MNTLFISQQQTDKTFKTDIIFYLTLNVFSNSSGLLYIACEQLKDKLANKQVLKKQYSSSQRNKYTVLT